LIFIAAVHLKSYEEKFPGVSGGLAFPSFISLAISALALLFAGLASLDSMSDSEVLQEQLTELKKISQILESNE
jgi:hypothetical protein